MHRPVIILGMARSGTSIVSSIFRAHGFWCGTTRADRPSNYPTGQHENLAIKRLLINRYGRADDRIFSVKFDKDWELVIRNILSKEHYPGGPWFVKHSALYGRLWESFNPYWVCVRRNTKDIIDSVRRKNPNEQRDDAFWETLIASHNITMDKIRRDFHGSSFDVHSENLIKDDYTEIYNIFPILGYHLDLQKVKEIIQPNIWGVTV